MQSEIEKKVMGNVAVIYVGRKLLGATALKLYVLAAVLVAITSSVSVPHVVANVMQIGITGMGAFAFTAILKTKLLVQMGLLIACAVLGSFVMAFVKTRVLFQRHFA